MSLAPTLLAHLYINSPTRRHPRATAQVRGNTDPKQPKSLHILFPFRIPPLLSILLPSIPPLLIIFTLALLCIQPLPLSCSSLSSHSSSCLPPLSTHCFKYTPPHTISQCTTFSFLAGYFLCPLCSSRISFDLWCIDFCPDLVSLLSCYSVSAG